jgi:ribosomal protein S18 acetylase RimI-like enzyme
MSRIAVMDIVPQEYIIVSLSTKPAVLETVRALLNSEFWPHYASEADLRCVAGGNEGAIARVALVDDAIAGICIGGPASGELLTEAKRFVDLPSGRIGSIETILVSDVYRRRGIGTSLSRAMLHALLRQGMNHILMAVLISERPDNSRGIARSAGLQPVGLISDFWLEESVERGYECSACGNPCRCAVEIWEGPLLRFPGVGAAPLPDHVMSHHPPIIGSGIAAASGEEQ